MGFITTDLLREILKELDEKMTPSDLDEMIEEIDIDGSGTVDWEGKLKMDNNYWFNNIYIFRVQSYDDWIIINYFEQENVLSLCQSNLFQSTCSKPRSNLQL